MGLGDLGAVEGAGDELFVGAEVVDEDLAVDLGGVLDGAALPEELGLFGFAFDEEVDLAADPLGLGLRADLLLELHQLAAAGLDGALGDFELGVELEGFGALFVGVGEDAEPVDLRGLDEGFELLVVVFGLAGEADDEAGADDDAGDDAAGLLDEVEEDFGVAAALHALEDAGAGVLQRDVEVLGDVVVLRDGLEQPRRDLVGVGVEEAEPREAGQDGEGVEQLREAVGEAEVFAVAGGVLADEGDLADALRDELFRLGDDGVKRRERNLPRSCGMMQKLQGWSQPSAILM